MPLPGNQELMMHKAEKKYEVGKVADEEQAKQRQIRAILNKLTPTNFEKLLEQGKAVNIDNAATLTGVISQIFDRALMEPIYCEIYVTFCCHLAMEFPDFNEDNEKITFKRVLLNKCQEEFERGEREQDEEANKADEEGQIKQSAEEREEKRVKARRRMLGNIRVIGELYKKKMLTERIMHACIQKFLGQYQDPDAEDVEALCKLMSTIGEMIDHEKAKEHMDAYFDRMKTLSNNMNLSSRVRFMLKDAIDLRKNKWQQRRKVEGPKKIEEVHRDASQEQQAQVSGLGHASSISQSARSAPMDFGSRGSTTLSSPNAQMDGYRGVPPTQDVRSEEILSYEAGNQELMIHKAEKKYEVGKVADEEQAKQRQIRAILNKLTPTNFEKLFEQVKAVNIDNAATLTGVISQIFDRALMEPTYCEMYVNFGCHLAMELLDFNEDNEKITFKRVLLNKCQEQFERGEREQVEEVDEEGQMKQFAVEREEKRVKARRRMLGNIGLIGELYKKKMLTERIMHACIQKFLGQCQDPDGEYVEALCKLMSNIGEMIDHKKAKEHMDRYFERMKTLSNNMNLSSSVRFMLKDAIDLRKNKWQQRRKVEGPKKINEVHRDAGKKRQAQVSWLGHASSINNSARGAPMDFGPTGSMMLSSPNAQMDGYRGVPPTQDVQSEERQSYDAGNLELMIKDLTLTNQLLLRKIKQWQWWFLVALNIFFLAVGQSAVVLIGRFYYVQGGNGKWMATLVQTAGFPILFIPLFLTPSSQQPSTSLVPPSIKIHALIYFSLGVLISGDKMMYSVGLLYLPASTYSLICVSQLAFNAVFSYYINSQKFTASIVNSLVVLSLSAALIAVNEDSEGPSGVSRRKYITCLLCTLGASALSSLLLSLMQLSFQKVLKRETFSVVLEMQIYTSLVATCVSIVGLFASGEWKSLHGEREGFGAGRVSYVMTLVWTAVAWQICSVGVVGLIFMVSSLFSNVISTSSLAVTPIATMIVFHDKMNDVKVIAMLLAIWGFASYNYQNYLFDSKASRTQKARRKQKDKGLIPSPQTPLLMMHKAEKKYEVGKVADEEETKQRQIRAILNKLTPTNFEKLFEQVKAVNIDNAATLTGVVSQIFYRALMEPIYCEMYADLCSHLAEELPDFNEGNEKVTFKRILLNKCQEEFERGEREQEEEANKADEEGEIKQSAEERVEKRIMARRPMLDNIGLIRELYKKKVLTERIMHACIQKLLGQYQDPDEEDPIDNTTQYRKSDKRSTSSYQQQGSSGAYVKGGGPTPSPSYGLSSGHSLKRDNNNAQGGQSRASVPTVNSSPLESSNVSTPHSAAVQNGSHVQPQFHGASDMPVTSPAESSAPQRSNRTVPKVPTSQPASMSSDSAAPRTPIKAPGYASEAFSFQFGSVSPGFMNGMQVPDQTSTAPPNLDEQKRDQARHDSFRSAAPLPTPSAPKQQLPRKDAGAVNQPNTSVADLPNLEHSRDLHIIISSAPSTTIPVTVKPRAGSIGEKVADSMRPNSSHGAEKGESPKHVRPSGEASSSHPERDSEICSESTLQQSKHDTEPLASKSLTPVATNQSAVSAVISSEGLVSNPLSSALVSPLPTPSAPKQQLLRKDAGAVNQPNTGEAYPVPKAKKDAQVSPAPPASQQQKPPGLPMTGMSIPRPFHQSQVSVQYGGPNQQLQSQGMTAAASLQMPLHMPLAMGNPPQVQPPVFVQGLQPHPMQTQGIIHQGQGLSFTTQMGPPQLPPQLSSMGITMSPQYSQQQGGKFGVPRKTTVKTTHPDTHEELRLDKRADSYSDGGSSSVRGRKKRNRNRYRKKKGKGCTLGLSLNDEKFSIEQCEDVASSSVKMCGSSVPRKTTVKITHPDTHEELRLDKRADSYSDGGSSSVRGRKKRNRNRYRKKKGEGCTLGLSLNDEKFSIEQCEDMASSSVKMCGSSVPHKTTVKITHPDTHEELRLDKRADSYSDGGSSSVRGRKKRNRNRYRKKKGKGYTLGLSLNDEKFSIEQCEDMASSSVKMCGSSVPHKTTVKITHPDTHEELRLDKRADSYSDGGSSSVRGRKKRNRNRYRKKKGKGYTLGLSLNDEKFSIEQCEDMASSSVKMCGSSVPHKTTVKITHPDTHEELRLDKRADSYSDGGSSSVRGRKKRNRNRYRKKKGKGYTLGLSLNDEKFSIEQCEDMASSSVKMCGSSVPHKTTVKITHPDTHEELRLDKRADSYSDGGSSSVRGRKKRNRNRYRKKKGKGYTLGLSLNDEKFSIEQCEDMASSSVKMCGSSVPHKTTVKITHPDTHEELRLDKRADSYSDGGSSSVRGRKKRNRNRYRKKKGKGYTLGLSLNDEKFSIEQCEDMASSSVKMCGSSVPHKTTVKITHPDTHEELRLDKRADSYSDGGSSSVRGRKKRNRNRFRKKKGKGYTLGLSLNDEKFSIEQCEDMASSSVKMCGSSVPHKTTVKITHPTHMKS